VVDGCVIVTGGEHKKLLEGRASKSRGHRGLEYSRQAAQDTLKQSSKVGQDLSWQFGDDRIGPGLRDFTSNLPLPRSSG
jgi:hypothetical protein